MRLPHKIVTLERFRLYWDKQRTFPGLVEIQRLVVSCFAWDPGILLTGVPGSPGESLPT